MTITGISVANGQRAVAIYSNAHAGNGIVLDDVEL